MQVIAGEAKPVSYLTEEACARVAKHFGLNGAREKELFTLVKALARQFEQHSFLPDHHQKKEVLEQLNKAFDDAVAIVSEHPQHLDWPIHFGILPFLGEIMSQHGLEKLVGHQLRLPSDIRHHRIGVALQIGPDLLVSFLDNLRKPIKDALHRAKLNKGGRPRHHLYRDFLIQELGRRYKRLFGRHPTTSPTGHFAQFCRFIFDELKLNQKGMEKALLAILGAAGVLKRSKPAGRKSSSR